MPADTRSQEAYRGAIARFYVLGPPLAAVGASSPGGSHGKGGADLDYPDIDTSDGTRLPEERMTATPKSEDGTFDPEPFAGWPGTLPTERLEEIIEYSCVTNLAVMGLYDRSKYNKVLHDIEMLSATMRNRTLAKRLPHDRLEHIGRSGEIAAFEDLLREHESDSDFCGGLVIDDNPDTDEEPWLSAFRYLFALSRDPDWMGLCPQLPHIKDLHVHAFESLIRPGRTGFFLGLPEKLVPARRREPGPAAEGEPRLLAEIAAWHGARSFNWIPASDWMPGSDGAGPPFTDGSGVN